VAPRTSAPVLQEFLEAVSRNDIQITSENVSNHWQLCEQFQSLPLKLSAFRDSADLPLVDAGFRPSFQFPGPSHGQFIFVGAQFGVTQSLLLSTAGTSQVILSRRSFCRQQFMSSSQSTVAQEFSLFVMTK
jgi:hypothetical protein